MSTLSKARFQRLANPGASTGTGLSVQFNPSELTFTKGAQLAEIPIPGLDSPLVQFVRGQIESMKIELLFDTTDDGQSSGATPVTKLTDKFYDLVKIDPTTHAPPVLLFSWGGESFPGKDRRALRCVVANIHQQYTMFSPDGVPLRAKLTVDLKEYKTLAQQIHELKLQSADHTKATVTRHGDTITSLAYRAYGDDRAWRLIADENGITNPLDLGAGAILRIPKAS